MFTGMSLDYVSNDCSLSPRNGHPRSHSPKILSKLSVNSCPSDSFSHVELASLALEIRVPENLTRSILPILLQAFLDGLAGLHAGGFRHAV